MSKKAVTTNAMRLLTQARVDFTPLYYDLGDEPFSSEAVCRALDIDPWSSFKTLCARGERQGVAVFVVPTPCELNLKAAAAALQDKALSLVHVRELPALTGYERGGVSPVGMKKRYPVFIDETARAFPRIRISGGLKGVSLTVAPDDLAAYLGARFAPIGTPAQDP